MAKLTLSSITSGYVVPATINANNAAVVAAMEKTLSRDGTSPNNMEANLDMDSNRILNLPAPASSTEPVRLIDLQDGSIDASTFVIPSQTGNAGKALVTDGAAAGWGQTSLTVGVTGTLPVGNGGTGITDLSTFAQTLLDDTTAAVARATLDVPSNAEAVLDSIIDAKGDLIVGTAADTPARKAVGSNGQTLVADSTQSDGLIWTDFSKDPLNVNPNMLLDQINEGSLYTVNTSSVRTLDAFSGQAVGGGVFKVRRIVDPDNAARYVAEITCTTADASIGATDQYVIYTALEGYDVAQLASGTSSAGQITIMFQFKSNVTGTYYIYVENSAGTRSYVAPFVVANTSVNNYAVTVQLDTSGAWLYTNGIGMYIGICLGVGSNFCTTANAWQAGNFQGATGNANFMSSNTNVAYLGRFHVIPGNVVCAYKPADVERELAKAQRQYEKSWSQGSAVGTPTTAGCVRAYQNFTALATGYTGLRTTFYRVSKRVSPTVTSYSHASGASGVVWDNQAGVDVAATLGNGSTESFDNNGTSVATTTILDFYWHWTANARIS